MVSVSLVIVATLDDIPPVAEHNLPIDSEWKPVRHHLGIGAFGINAYVGQNDGDLVIEEHTEDDLDHEELYYVARGRAEFGVGDDTVDAPAGTFVFYPDPAKTRRAVAREPGTTVVAIGGPRGGFSPSEWETRRTSGLPRA
jgi:hypothetical protein